MWTFSNFQQLPASHPDMDLHQKIITPSLANGLTKLLRYPAHQNMDKLVWKHDHIGSSNNVEIPYRPYGSNFSFMIATGPR